LKKTHGGKTPLLLIATTVSSYLLLLPLLIVAAVLPDLLFPPLLVVAVVPPDLLLPLLLVATAVRGRRRRIYYVPPDLLQLPLPYNLSSLFLRLVISSRLEQLGGKGEIARKFNR